MCYAASAKTESKGKRYQRQAQSVAEADDDTLRRAIWTTAYWIQNGFTCQCVTVHTGEQPVFRRRGEVQGGRHRPTR